MISVLEGKKTAIAAFLVALYGLLKALGVIRTELPVGWEEGALGVLFFVLRLLTRGPNTVPGLAPAQDDTLTGRRW